MLYHHLSLRPIVGGELTKDYKSVSSACYRYDVVTDSWQNPIKSGLLAPRRGSIAWVYNNHLWIGMYRSPLTCCLGHNLIIIHRGCNCRSVSCDCLWLGGGALHHTGYAGHSEVRTIERYSFVDDKWSAGDPKSRSDTKKMMLPATMLGGSCQLIDNHYLAVLQHHSALNQFVHQIAWITDLRTANASNDWEFTFGPLPPLPEGACLKASAIME
jgi:hypothetical protein